MAKRPKKVEKKKFDLDSFLEKGDYNKSSGDKELTWIPLSKAWHDALKLPGFPRGYLSLVRGFSNTGKSTAFYEAIAGAQAIGDFPIVIETEGAWNDKHAEMCGVKYKDRVNKSTGEISRVPDGFILFKQKDLYDKYKNYCHKDSKFTSKPTRGEPVIEDVALLMSEFLDMQADGEFDANICFLWDSIGTLNCYKSATSNSSNNQWNAGAMNVFQSLVNFKIPSSRDSESEFTNTFICVQKIWLDNMAGAGVVKHKGGEFMFFNARIIVHIGGVISHGTKKLNAISLKQKIQFGTECDIYCVKNHISGIERRGRIASTPHGYVNPDEIDVYKKTNQKFIHEMLNVPYDTPIDYETEDGDDSEIDTTDK